MEEEETDRGERKKKRGGGQGRRGERRGEIFNYQTACSMFNIRV